MKRQKDQCGRRWRRCRMCGAGRGGCIRSTGCWRCRCAPCCAAVAVCTPSPVGPGVRTGDPRGAGAAGGARAERADAASGVSRLDHAAFERVLTTWFAAQGLEAEEAIAIDGKTLRGIHGEEIPGVHLVAAFAHQTRVVLAQAETRGKGHELAGVEAVLAHVAGAPAGWAGGHGGCALGQRALCQQIVEKGGTISSS